MLTVHLSAGVRHHHPKQRRLLPPPVQLGASAGVSFSLLLRYSPTITSLNEAHYSFSELWGPQTKPTATLQLSSQKKVHN